MQNQEKNSAENVPENQDRRKIIKKIAVGAGVLAGYNVLPDKWIRPFVGQITLPAHAATSGPAAASKGGYNTSKVYTLRNAPGNNKRYTWLDRTGSYYGGRIMFDFGGCGKLVVPNASVTYGADGNRSNHNQAYYFCGTDFPKTSREYNAGKASVFSPPNCRSSTVTMYYNR